MASTDTPLLTCAEAADLANVSVLTIKRWIRSGKLQALRPTPRIVRIKVEELDRFLEGN